MLKRGLDNHRLIVSFRPVLEWNILCNLDHHHNLSLRSVLEWNGVREYLDNGLPNRPVLER